MQAPIFGFAGLWLAQYLRPRGTGASSWNGETSRVTIFEAAMGPQIGGAIMAMQYGLSPSRITLMVGVGIALSFLTLPLWYVGLTLI